MTRTAPGGCTSRPYNDAQVIGGQGTVAVELLRQLEHLDVILVPVGGGGLIGGIAAHLKARAPKVHVVGCQPAACRIMVDSVTAGRIVELASAPSLSDATVGLVEAGAITLPVCQACVDEWVVLDEPAIRAALRLVLERRIAAHRGRRGAAGGRPCWPRDVAGRERGWRWC